MAVYAERGPPPFVGLAILTGWKPRRKVSAGDEEIISEAHLKSLISQFSGGAPPSLELGDGDA